MYQFIESIYWKDGLMPLIDWHEERFAGTQIAHFGTLEYPSLHTLIELNIPENIRAHIVHKIRITYDLSHIQIDFEPYERKKIKALKLTINDTLEYAFKYSDRTVLDLSKKGFPDYQEAIIIKNGLLTDTTFTNIALWDGNSWQTPALPLLEGVQRSYLLNNSIIEEADIMMSNLSQYQKIRLFNAMISWEEAWEFPISSILSL